jgi:hypothetical protein
MHVCDLDYRENDRGEKDYCERGPEDRGEHYQADAMQRPQLGLARLSEYYLASRAS